MQDDVILNKCETIRKCLKRIHVEYRGSEHFMTDYTVQDAIILNLERLSQACIDIAAHVIRVKKLGVPQTTREVFQILQQSTILSAELSQNMQKMVGFRNVAVHDYQALNMDVLIHIIEHRLDDFKRFGQEILNGQV